MKAVNDTLLTQTRIKTWIKVAMIIADVKSGYETQKKITPDSFSRTDEGTKYPKKYTKYITKDPAPKANERTLAITENSIPNTRIWFDMPLWDALDMGDVTAKNIDILILKITEPDALEFIAPQNTNIQNIPKTNYSLDEKIREVKLFEKTPDMLSSLIILMLQSELEDNPENCYILFMNLKQALINCLIVIGWVEEFITLYNICVERFFYRWRGNKKHRNKISNILTEEDYKEVETYVSLGGRLVEIAIKANRANSDVLKFLILDEYFTVEDEVKKYHIHLLNNDISTLQNELTIFLANFYSKSK